MDNDILLENLNSKIKTLPEALIKEVDQYIDFLKFKYLQEKNFLDIPKSQKDFVLDRINNPETTVDAFEMLKNIEGKSA